jgi:hypothetical protein
LDYGGVVVYENIFYSEGWDFGKDYAAKGIDNRGIYTDEGE